MTVLFDTNVILDVLLEREPHVDAAAKLFALVENGRIGGAMCATTATTIYYIAAKSFGRHRAQKLVRELLRLFEVAPVNREVLSAAVDADFADYEDAVVHEAACFIGAVAIVTRDREGFANSVLPVYYPRELLAAVADSPSLHASDGSSDDSPDK